MTTTSNQKSHLGVRMLCEGAIMIALSLVLGLLKVFELPQGGSVSLEMLPLLLFCVRWGMGGGLIACFAFGILQVFIQGAVSWGWQSILLDYVLAFGVIGVAGLGKGKPGGIFWGSILGGAAGSSSTTSAVLPFIRLWPRRRSSARCLITPPSTRWSTTAAMWALTSFCAW